MLSESAPQSSLVVLSVLIVLISAAICDLRNRRIPNELVFGAALIGIGLQVLLIGFDGLLDAFAGLAVGLAILLPGYLFGTTGAGDVKLMAAIGTFLGSHDVFLAALASITVGSLVALGFVVGALFSRGTPTPWARYGLMFKTLFVTGRPIYISPAEGEVMGRKFPFAVSIALGTTLFLLWQSPLIEWAK